ncbi:MAG: chemotaxis response regulator protein-glutamate methylesterase [Acidobacteriota bacterium]|jgi:two-component system chemotaxis response regulator CheB|nr:chemotaxis response regulator protein-glutamate methylesterase [Acidobacteriota bacterium]
MQGKIRVLVVDDSALVRQILSRGLGMDPDIVVVGTANDPYMARDKIMELRPDVLTLDVEMPKMDGVQFLRRLMPQHPLPVVMVSSLTQRGGQITLDALDAGAVDFVTKPTANMAAGLQGMIATLCEKVKIAARANVSHWKKDRQAVARNVTAEQKTWLAGSTDKVIAIGASTGGTEALRALLTRFPADMPGVVVVQHMPAGFTKMFADRLDDLCAMKVKEAVSGDRVRSGHVLIAPGGKQLKVIRSGGTYQVACHEGPKVSGHCPSVDVMMDSVAHEVGPNAVGVMLTGMGSDGAEGMLRMRQAGGRNIAQDEESCVVFGMPKVAFEKGGAERLVPLDKMPVEIICLLKEMSR